MPDLLHRMNGLQAWDNTPREEKLTWGEGPWVDEPDKVQWVDTETNLDCLIVRNHSGVWCGYVGLPPGHRLHGVAYTEAEGGDGQWWLDVHGGLTFSGACQDHEDADLSHGICHLPLPGRPADVWWLGFDCGHALDQMPALDARMRDYEKMTGVKLPQLPALVGDPFRSVYRDLPYVQEQVTRLAEQLA